MANTKTVLITGASTGIGRATAQLFQEKGWNVAATMRSPEAGKDLQTLNNVAVMRLDVTDSGSVDEAVAGTLARFGGIDALVNNAGYGAYGALEALSMDTIRRAFETNVMGPLLIAKAVLPHFRKQGDGVIINISSIGGKIAFPLGVPYHGTKFALEGISEALNYEMLAIGVKVKIVEPAATKTDFSGKNFEFSDDPSLDAYREIVNKVQTGAAAFMDSGVDASVVAEVIYRAATDGTDQLRYPAGEAATQMLTQRKAESDETQIRRMREMFGL